MHSPRTVPTLLALLGLATGAGTPAAAQSPDWGAVAIVQPFPSPFLGDWDRYPSTGLLTVTYTGTASTAYRVRVILTHETRGEIGVVESPEETVAGGPSSRAYLANEIARWIATRRQAGLVSEITRTGLLPEGRYRACGQVLVGANRSQVAEGCAEFTIALPEPPRLLAPDHRAVVAAMQPMLQWTPVLVPPPLQVRYRVKVVELLGQQAPVVALAANIPMLDEVVQAPFLIYPLDALPLEPNRRYAWQVTATDAEGRQIARTQVQSEIYLFETAEDLLRPPPLLAELPDEVIVQPGVATLRGLRGARTRRGETEVTVDGTLTLVLDAAGGTRVPVTVRDLRLGYRGADLVLTAGGFEAPLPADVLPRAVRDLVQPGRLVFTPEAGLRATARFALPGRGGFPLDGALQLTPAGWYGRLTGQVADGAALAGIGGSPVQLGVTGADLTLPQGTLRVQGALTLWGQDVGCRQVTGEVTAGVLEAGSFCEPTRAVPLAGRGPTDLRLGTFGGALVADFLADTLGYELRTSATLRLLGERDFACQSTFQVVLTPGALETSDNRPRCDPTEAVRDLGWISLRFGNLALGTITDRPGQLPAWRATVDITPRADRLDGLALGAFRAAVFDQDGLALPAFEEEVEAATAAVDGMAFTVTRVAHPALRQPWGDFDLFSEPPFRFALTGTLRYAGAKAAACLAEPELALSEPATLQRGTLAFALADTRLRAPCDVEVAPGITASISTIRGDAEATLRDAVRLVRPPIVWGAVDPSRRPTEVIGCALDLGVEMRLRPTGRLVGPIVPGETRQLADFTLEEAWSATKKAVADFFTGKSKLALDGCEVDLRLATLKLENGSFAFAVGPDGAQQATYTGSAVATVRLPDTGKPDDAKDEKKSARPASGDAPKPLEPGQARRTITLDWIRGELTDGSFELTGPFLVRVGEFQFEVGAAALERRGLVVDGEHKLMALGLDLGREMWQVQGDSVKAVQDTFGIAMKGRVPAVFDMVTLRPGSLTLGQGTITFPRGFSLLSHVPKIAIDKGAGVVSTAVGVAGAAQSVGFAAYGLVTGSPRFDPLPTDVEASSGFATSLDEAFFAIWLPLPAGALSIDRDGLRIPNGQTRGLLRLAGSTYRDLRLEFQGNVGVAAGSARVATGRIDFMADTFRVAYLDRQGLHPAVAELASQVLPARIPLPSADVAYLQLRRDDGTLLVDVSETDNGYRVRATAARPARLVVPILRGTRAEDPSANVELDIQLNTRDWSLRSGDIRVITTGRDGFDLRPLRIPMGVDSVSYRRAPGGQYAFTLGGSLRLLGNEPPLANVAVTVAAGGVLSGTIDRTVTTRVNLVPAGGRLSLELRRVTGTFRGTLGRDASYEIDAIGSVVLAPTPDRTYRVDATLRATPGRLEARDVALPGTVPLLEHQGLTLALGNPRLPHLAFDTQRGRWSFRFLFDVAFALPALGGLVLPTIEDAELRSDGIHVPAQEFSSIPSSVLANGAFGLRPASGTDTVRADGYALRVLGFRMDALTWDWLTGAVPPPTWGFGLDLSLKLGGLPATAPAALRGLELRALDVGFRDGRLTGQLEPIVFPTPLALPGLEVTSLWGDFGVQLAEVPDVADALRRTTIRVGARVGLPEALVCDGVPPTQRTVVLTEYQAAQARAAAGAADLAGLTLSGEGWVSGRLTNVVPACTGRLGPFPYRVTQSTIAFSTRAGAQALTLAGTAELALPAPTGPDSIRVGGTLAVDLLRGTIDDAAFGITQPFRLPLGGAGGAFVLRVDQATIDRTGIALAGTGGLFLDGGGTATVAFTGARFGFAPFALTEGSLRIESAIGLGVAIGGDQALAWGAYPQGGARPAGASFRLELPANVVVDREGLAVAGSVTASLGFGGQEWATLGAEFSPDFRIGFEPVGVRTGQVTFRGTGGEAIAHADNLGFWPGNVFAALPIPDRLPLPDLGIAYLVLREPGPNGRVNFEQAPVPGTGRIRIFTRPGQPARLVVPALAYGGAAPEITTEFSLEINPQLMRVVGGSLEVQQGAGGTPVIGLAALPVDVTRLRFAAAPGGYQLTADARVKLPASVSQLPLVFRDLTLSPAGFSGTAELGTYASTWAPGRTTVVSRQFLGDTLEIGITGVRATFGTAGGSSVAIAGYLQSSLFRPAGSSAPATLFLSGGVTSSGFTAAVDFTPLPSSTLPLGAATFTPQAINGKPAFTFTANAQEVALTLGGTFRLPTVAPNFAVAITDLKLSSRGITAPAVSITAPTETQAFQLFGAEFRLRDSTVGGQQAFPAVAVGVGNGAFRLTLSGELTLLQNTTRFVGLSVSSQGEFTLAGASLISSPVAIIPQRLFLDQLGIASGQLTGTIGASLPAPFDDSRQTASFTIAPDGTFSGGGTFTLVNEAEGLATATTTQQLGEVTFHLRRAVVTVAAGGGAAIAELKAVADLYVANDAAKRIRLGRVVGSQMTPGLTISSDRGVEWGAIEVTDPIVFPHDVVELEIRRGTARPSAQGLAVDLSGALRLRVKDSRGELTFENIGLTEQGEVRIAAASIADGTVTIADAFTLTIRGVKYADSDTIIQVPRGTSPGSDGTVSSAQTDPVQVSSFLSFGGTVDVKEVFNGGVRQVLVYRGTDGSSHLLVDRLTAGIPKTLSFTGSLRYDEYNDGFELAVGASAQVLDEFSAAMVGLLAQRSGSFRAGLFVSVSAPIPIVPGVVMLSEVGGGFFINPRSQDLDLVRSVARLDGKTAAKIGSPPGGKFAVMLYAAVAGLGTSGASAFEGRALVTITDQVFRLDGAAQFFQLKDELKGELAVQVGFDPAYVRGNVLLAMKFDKAITGSVQLEFAAGGGKFAVRGTGDISLAKVLTGNARFVVVPSGVMVRVTVGLKYNLSVVSLDGSLAAAVWYKPPSNLGAYLDANVAVTIFGGVAGASARLAGALILQPEPALFAMGTARAFVLDKAVELKVWVQWADGAVSGGEGDNPAMAQAIADANRVMKELEEEADKILKEIERLGQEIRNRQLTVPPQVLAAAWNNASRFSRGQGAGGNVEAIVLFGLPLASERGLAGGVGPNDPNRYLDRVAEVFRGTGAPSDTTAIRLLGTQVATRLALLEDRRAAVEAQLAGVQAQLAELQAIAYGTVEDPVTSFSDAQVVMTPGAKGPDGRTEMRMTSEPGFGLDDQKAESGRDAATASRDAVASRAERIRERLAAGDALLAQVRAATTDAASGSLLGYARVYADAVALAEEQHAAQIDFLMRRRAWAAERRASLAADTAAFRQHLAARIAAMPATNSEARYRLAQMRAGALQAWSGDGTRLQAIEAMWRTNPFNGTFFTQDALAMGQTLWRDVPFTGLLQQEQAGTVEIANAVTAANTALTPVRQGQREFSASLADAMERQAELTGALYDLYDQAILELGTAGNEALVARRSTLAALLAAPRVTAAQVTVSDFGFRSRMVATWSGTHGSGVYEYLARRADTLTSVGAAGNLTRWFWSTDAAAPSRSETISLLARGGAGATAERGVPFTVTFRQGTPDAPSVGTPFAAPQDLTPPPAPAVSFAGRAARTEPFLGARAWTPNADAILVEWDAVDRESGIASFEYRLLELPPLSFTPVEVRPWADAGARTSITLTGLALVPGRRLLVEVRARNGAGLQGASGYSPQLLLDTTAPVWPQGSYAAVFPQSGLAQWPPVATPACSRAFLAPPSSAPPAGLGGSPRDLSVTAAAAAAGMPVVVGGGATGTLVVQRPDASDPESGIRHYLVRFDEGPAQPAATEGWIEVAADGSRDVSLPGLPYGAQRTVTVIAVNWAGARSVPTSFPAELLDPTAPSTAPFCAAADLTGTLVLGFNALATDAESGIRGYQLRVRGPGGVILRDWPAAGTVDVEAWGLGTNTPIRTGLGLNDGQGYTIELRAVNGARAAGLVTASGPFTADRTAPPAPAVSLAWQNTLFFTRSLVITASVPADPQTGTAFAEYAVGTTPGGTELRAWTPVSAAVPGVSTMSIDLGGRASRLPGTVFHVSVRSRNGFGVPSETVTATEVWR